LLVPSRGLLILGWRELRNFSGIIVMLVILIFIGGLLILLVGVSSTISQEQNTSGLNFFLSWGIPLSVIIVLMENKNFSTSFQVFLFSWLNWRLTTLYLICSVLVFSLSLITWLTIPFKGSLRGLYNNTF